VCPTGAIRAVTLKERMGEAPFEEPLRIGTAFIDRGRCLPWAMETQCIVCEEVCPASHKAVHYKIVEILDREDEKKLLKRPYVDATKCIGCGVCETRCPVYDKAAIRVTSVGETRDPHNRIVLSKDKV
jgi:ferredoxin